VDLGRAHRGLAARASRLSIASATARANSSGTKAKVAPIASVTLQSPESRTETPRNPGSSFGFTSNPPVSNPKMSKSNAGATITMRAAPVVHTSRLSRKASEAARARAPLCAK
jgi:hypothetical protein